MSADLTELKDSITQWANAGAGQALDNLRQTTHDRCPVGVYEESSTGPHLLETEEAQILSEGDTWQGTLAYTADHASYLDLGTSAHEITGNPLLSFMWGGQRIIVHSVQHPGSTIHVGWFSDVTDEAAWVDALEQALDAQVAV